VLWKPCSSCWSFHLIREEFLSALIHFPLSGRQFRSFTVRCYFVWVVMATPHALSHPHLPWLPVTARFPPPACTSSPGNCALHRSHSRCRTPPSSPPGFRRRWLKSIPYFHFHRVLLFFKKRDILINSINWTTRDVGRTMAVCSFICSSI
jgi:hypothetical protein